MKTAWLLITSELLLLLTIVCVFSNWQGSVNLQAGDSVASFALSITGGAKGGWIVLAILCLMAALVTFVAGLVRTIKAPQTPAAA